MPAEPEIRQQLYAPGYFERRATVAPMPEQLLEMPIGWIRAHHVDHLNIGNVVPEDGAKPLVMLLTYAGGIGDDAGVGMLVALPPEAAREAAASIVRAADLADGGLDYSNYARRPPAKEE